MNYKLLKTLLDVEFNKLIDCQIFGISSNSKIINPGDLFIALRGAQYNGQQFIAEALEKGASAVLYENFENTLNYINNVPIIGLMSLNKQVAKIAARFYDYPSRDLIVLGVTGTNGKTTIAHLLAEALTRLKIPTASLGTLGLKFKGLITDFGLTTPDVISLQKNLAMLRDAGAIAVAMEVSSHALVQGRVNEIYFTGAIFTNLTQDHLDYHGTMDAYCAAKTKLFACPHLKFAVINMLDSASVHMLEALKPKVMVYGCGLSLIALEPNLLGPISFTVQWAGSRIFIQTQLRGEFNIENILSVIATLLGLGIDLHTIAKILPQIEAAPGRMQCMGGGTVPDVIVDYAHTPDALKKALLAARTYVKGKLWCVFGCGGDRDPTKRAQMGKIVSELADNIIITNDNPRTEDPNIIIKNILEGILDYDSNIHIEIDRKKAITYALSCAALGDVILVAGKGHENYQIIGTEKHYFSDIECIDAILNAN